MTTKIASAIRIGDQLIARGKTVLKNDYRRGNAITVVDIKPDKNPSKIQLFLSFCDKRTDKNQQTLPAKFDCNEIVQVK